MKRARFNRLFNPETNRCFDVAIDHGFFNEGSFLSGIEDLPGAVAAVVAAAPDAIQLTVGQGRFGIEWLHGVVHAASQPGDGPVPPGSEAAQQLGGFLA